LDAVPDSFFGPGTWTLSQAPGKGLTPFSVGLPVGPLLRITNTAELRVIDRHQDAILRWNPQGFSDNQIVKVRLNPADPTLPTSLACFAPAQAGSVTIPAALLAGVPSATDPNNPANFQVELSTRVGSFSGFQIPAVDGSPILGGFRTDSLEIIPVTIQ
jgi:hypothetical protein